MPNLNVKTTAANVAAETRTSSADGHLEGDILLNDHHLVGPEGTDWIEAFPGAASVGGGQLTIDQAFGGILNDTLTPALVQGTSYTITWTGLVLTAGSIDVRLGSGAGGTADTIVNGQLSAVVIAGVGVSRISFDDVGNGGTGFVLTGPIIINLT